MSEQGNVSTIICEGGVILEVYEGGENDEEENVVGVEGSHIIEQVEGGQEEEEAHQTVIVNEDENGFVEGVNRYVTVTNQNGETVYCLVNEEDVYEEGGEGDENNGEERMEDEEGDHQLDNMAILPLHKPFKCDLDNCHKSFTRKSDLRRHKKIHGRFLEEIKTNACPICESCFGFKQVSGLSKKPFVCGVCDKGYVSVRELKRHFNVHVKENPFMCDVCDSSFPTQEFLKKHALSHNTEKPYGCEICGKSFRIKCNLKSHLRVHSEDRPHGCGICQRSFKSTCELKSHLLIHTDERPFPCQDCGKRFRQSGNLNAHLRIHRQERPFVCPTCNKGFVESGKLKRHIRTHTGEKNYICSRCGKGFCDSSNMKSHMKIHDKDNAIYVMYVDEDEQQINMTYQEADEQVIIPDQDQ